MSSSFTPYLLLWFECHPRIYELKPRYCLVNLLIIVWIKIVNNNDNNNIKTGAVLVDPLHFWGKMTSHDLSAFLIS